MTFREFIDKFPLSFFASTMGTFGLGIAFYFVSKVSESLSWAYWFGYSICVVGLVMFLFLLVPWTLKLVTRFDIFRSDVNHPIHGAFLPTIAISLLLLSFAMLVFEKHTFLGNSNFEVAFGIFVFASILVLVFGIINVVGLFLNETVDMIHCNYGWFIPPVAHIIITRVGLEFISKFDNTFIKEITFWFILFTLAIGLFMYIFLGSIVLHRYIFHEIPSGALAPTTFIQMAPLGIFSSVFFKMISIFGSSSVVLFSILSILFWAFGMWWLILAVVMMILHIKDKGLPFAMSWWAFVFPLVAMTFGTFAVANIGSDAAKTIFNYIGVLLTFVTLVVWVVVFITNINKLVKGEIF